MKKPSTSTALPALAAALALALAGCGGGGTTPGTGVTPPGGDTTPDTETTPEGDTTQNIRPTPGGGGGGPSGPPVITFVRASLYEGETAARITVNLGSATTAPITLIYMLDGVRGSYDIPADTPAGMLTFRSRTITAATRGTTPQLVFVDTADDGYNIGTSGLTHSLPEVDELPSEPELSVLSTGKVQVGGTVTVTVMLTSPPASDITLMYTVDGTADTETIRANHSGNFTFDVSVPQGKTAGQNVSIVLTEGTGYTVASGGGTLTVAVTGTPPPPPPPPGVLGKMDQTALNAAINAVNKPNCGSDAACTRIVKKLEDRAKAYNPFDEYNELLSESVGEGTYEDARDSESPPPWIMEVETYQLDIGRAIYEVENASPPHTPDAAHIASVVNAAINVDNFVVGENRIASDFGNENNDAWGVWIKEGDTGKLYYWHTEDGTPTVGTTSAAGFPASAGYAGTATYDGGVDGYGHYTDSSDSNAQVAGRLGATIQLRADFENASSEFLTGTISDFRVDDNNPGWEDVTLTHDYGVQGATTAANVTGNWRSDAVYDVADNFGDGSQRQPESIRGRVVLDFTGATANPGKAAGVFEVNQPPPSP